MSSQSVVIQFSGNQRQLPRASQDAFASRELTRRMHGLFA